MEDFENSFAFFILLVAAFPFLFAAMWCLILALLSHVSGWSRLAKFYRYNDETVSEWQFRGGGGVYTNALRYAGMRGRLAVGAAQHGIAIKPAFMVRPFHPPLFLPFEKMTSEEDQKMLGLDLVLITMQDAPDVRVAILKSARDMARQRIQPATA